MLASLIYIMMDEQSSEILKTVFFKYARNNLFTSILEDPDMTSEFVVEPNEPIEERPQEKLPEKEPQEESVRESVEKQETRSNISRLEIEIDKNDLNLVPISGEVFFMLVSATLEGKNSEENGKLMMTNYRVVFFKEGAKRVDLPFGRISKVEYLDKQLRIVFTLKYPHQWRFRVGSSFKFGQFKNVGDIYYKTDNIKKVFAFEYALKIIPMPQPYHYSITEEYKRLRFDSMQHVQFFGQVNYQTCPTYPSIFYIASIKGLDLNALANHRKNKRLPILAYNYTPSHSKSEVPLWVSSSYEQQKTFNKAAQKQLLNGLKCGFKLEIFVAESKIAKGTDEHHFDKNFSMNYLKLQSGEQLCAAEKHLFEVFLANKKPFMKEIINSKWYNYVAGILAACQTLRNLYLQETAILLRCETGYDKSLTLASLLQLIIDPYYRTFNGLESLVMRMWVHYGHPFGQRLGVRNGTSMCPTFLQFLDCVSQLIHQNPSSFEFNFKYLGRIASLMQLNIYGTFLANSSKEYKDSRIEVETCSIWSDLPNPITTNGFYDKKAGILEVESSLSSMRIWKEHFGDMISRNKDHYGFEEMAEDNDDYLNLYSLRLKEENQQLLLKMKQKMSELEALQRLVKQQGK